MEWRGSGTFDRLNSLARGVVKALARHQQSGSAVVLACDDDVGSVIGKHIVEELSAPLSEIVPGSGAVPVIIKSLVFPALVSGGGDDVQRAPAARPESKERAR